MATGSKFRGKKWHALVGTIAFGVASIGVTAAALPSGASTGASVGTTSVVECRSGVETSGGVSVASSVAVRVSPDQIPDTIPGDCVVTNG
jgi:hypothetical protein